MTRSMKTKAINQSPRVSHIVAIVFRVGCRFQGLRGIYRGFDVAVLGVGAWRALYFGFYDTFTTRLLGGRQAGTLQQRWAVAQLVTTSAGT